MAKEDKYIVAAIALPVLDMVFIGVMPSRDFHGLLVGAIVGLLLLPTPFLLYKAKQEVFGKKTRNQPILHATATTTKAKPKPTKAARVAEENYKRLLRNISITLTVIGTPLVYGGWRIVRATNRLWYYVLGGAMLLVGTICVGAAVGFMMVVNDEV